MATGISRTKWNGRHVHQPSADQHVCPPDVQLDYAGKRTKRDILSTKPVATSLLWPHGAVKTASFENCLYYGDNLHVLATLLADASVRGHVRLVYIDPPFATRSVFHSREQAAAYTDLLAGAHYLEFLRERLILLRELLSDDGSIYVHVDDNMAFYVKVLMDEVFGSNNFRNWITRKKCNPKNYTRKAYGNTSDFIMFYTKSDTYVWNRPVEPWPNEGYPKEYRYIDNATGRRYMKVPLHAPGVRNGESGKPWRGMLPPPGKHWQYIPATLDEMDARGEIYWSPNGNPRRKVFLDTSSGVPVQDIWLDYRDAHNQNIKITGYPTEKNLELLQRIVAASSNPGDMVLDCFAGSATTLVAASRLGRKWIGVDNSAEAISTSLRRFVKGSERMGDYVSKRPQKMKQGDPVALSLFPEFETDESPSPPQPIVNFALFAAEPYAGDLDTAIQKLLGDAQ